jgi:glycosyltransferase involved in cell wall biosynthesis
MSDFAKNDSYLADKKIEITYIKLKSTKKAVFIEFYIKALPIVIKNKINYMLCPDIYSIPLAYIAYLFFKCIYIYDSRELFTDLASLKKKKIKQFIWKLIEKFFVPKAKFLITVNESIAKILRINFPNKKIEVINNFPSLKLEKEQVDISQIIGSDTSKKILTYQGGLQHGRGIGILLDLISSMEECILLFLGNGQLKTRIKYHPLFNKRVFMKDNIPASQVLKYTTNSFLGMSIIENLSKSYYLSLPNKIFEYIHAGVPVISSNFPEIQKIITQFNVGELVDPENKQDIIQRIKFLIDNPDIYNTYKQNCINARETLNWENQESKFLLLFQS